MSCQCHGCEERYTVDINIPDELWARIRPSKRCPEGAGLLCPRCIGERIQDIGGYKVFELKRIVPDIPVVPEMPAPRKRSTMLDRIVHEHKDTFGSIKCYGTLLSEMDPDQLRACICMLLEMLERDRRDRERERMLPWHKKSR